MIIIPLTIFIGDRGSGKNREIVAILIQKLEEDPSFEKIPVFSNFFIDIPNYKFLSLAGIMYTPDDCIIVIDEAYGWIESRHSAKYTNVYISYIAFQLRKTNRQIFITAQLDSTIDLRFREFYDYKITCERIPSLEYIDNPDKWDFCYDKEDKRRGRFIKIVPYDEASKIFKYYDTNEIVSFPAKSRMEYELYKTEPRKFFIKGLEIFQDIQSLLINKEKNLISKEKNFIKLALLSKNYDMIWADLMYLIANNNVKNLITFIQKK